MKVRNKESSAIGSKTVRVRNVFLLSVVLGLGVGAVYLHHDLIVFLKAAEQILAGKDPYGAMSDRGWFYYYPPTLAALITPLTMLPQRVAAAVWFALATGLLALGIRGCRRALGRTGCWQKEEWIALALIALPAGSALVRGQVGPLLLGLVGIGFSWLANGVRDRVRGIGAGVFIALATAVKLTPGLILAGLALSRRGWACLGAFLGLVLWLLVLPAFFLGLDGALASNQGVLMITVAGTARNPALLALPGGRALDLKTPINQSLTNQIAHRFAPSARAILIWSMTGLLLAACLPLAWLARNEVQRTTAWSLLLAVPLLVNPIAWHHHHVVLYPVILVLAAHGGRTAWTVLSLFALLSFMHFASFEETISFIKPLRSWGLMGWGALAVIGTVIVQSWCERIREDFVWSVHE